MTVYKDKVMLYEVMEYTGENGLDVIEWVGLMVDPYWEDAFYIEEGVLWVDISYWYGWGYYSFEPGGVITVETNPYGYKNIGFDTTPAGMENFLLSKEPV